MSTPGTETFAGLPTSSSSSTSAHTSIIGSSSSSTPPRALFISPYTSPKTRSLIPLSLMVPWSLFQQTLSRTEAKVLPPSLQAVVFSYMPLNLVLIVTVQLTVFCAF